MVVSAASSAFVMAASVAWTVAWNSGEIRSFESICTVFTGGVPDQAPGLAVENAMKMSPDPFSPNPPCRPMPSDTRVATRFN